MQKSRRGKAGDMLVDSSKLDLDAVDITIQYPEDIFPGHFAWLDWPFKLHRIQEGSGIIKIELYNLEVDPLEKSDLAEKKHLRLNP